MSVLKRGNKNKLFDVPKIKLRRGATGTYTLPARNRIVQYESMIQRVEKCIQYWKNVRNENQISEYIRLLKRRLIRLRYDSLNFRKRNSLSVARIRRILGGLNKGSRIPKCDFDCTYIPLLTYPLTENIGTFTKYFGQEGELLPSRCKDETPIPTCGLKTVGINEEALKDLRRLYADKTRNQMTAYAAKNAMGVGQISDECEKHVAKFHETLSRVAINHDEGRQESLDEFSARPVYLTFDPPPL